MKRKHNSQNDHREYHYVTEFLKAIKHNPETLKRLNAPEPDFGFYLENSLIGIEETQIVHIDEKGFNRAQHISTCKAVTAKAQEIFDSYEVDQDIEVYVSFADHSGTISYTPENLIQKNERGVIALQIASLVLNHMSWVPGGEIVIDHYDPYFLDMLSRKIDRITVSNVTSMRPSLWSSPYGGVCPKLTPEVIKREMKRKNTKPKNYKVLYSEIWLLLTTHRFRFDANYVKDDLSEILSTRFETPFTRVFVFDVGDKELIELQPKS